MANEIIAIIQISDFFEMSMFSNRILVGMAIKSGGNNGLLIEIDGIKVILVNVID